MKNLVLLVLLLSSTFSVEAQIRKHKKKHATNAGTLFVGFGVNRDIFFQSKIRFVGADYDYSLKNVKGYDRESKGQSNLDFAQFNLRLGYYYTDRWAITLGFDRLSYIMADQNQVLLDGKIEPGVDTSWSGTYYDQPVTTNRNAFHYQNKRGLNFIRLELMRSIDLFELGTKRQLALTANVGISGGPVVTINSFRFAQKQTSPTTSFAGYGLGATGGLRLEFFKHVYFQFENSLAFAHLLNARTRSDDKNQYSKQFLGYYTFNLSVGAMFYLNAKNGCDSCPHW